MFLSEEELKKPSSVVLPEDDEPHGKILCIYIFSTITFMFVFCILFCLVCDFEINLEFSCYYLKIASKEFQ